MFRNYLVTALRNFTRHRLYSFINVAGLAVALACAIFILLFIRDELSYDKWIPGSDDLYRVEVTFHFPGEPVFPSGGAPFPLTPNRPWFWIASLTKRKTLIPPPPESGARSAVGRHAGMTVGRVAAVTVGTRSTPGEFAPPLSPVDFNAVPLV